MSDAAAMLGWMETGTEEQKTNPWHWPGKWTRDENFWRGVTSNALSGLIVVFVGYLAALWMGYVQSPNGLRSAFETTWLIVFILSTVTVVDKYGGLKLSKKMAGG